MRVEKKIRIIALDKRYRKHVYQFAVTKSERTGRFITGQEEYLTEEQMTGKKEITKSTKDSLQMGDQPFIINPYNHYGLLHGRTFDLSYNIDDKDNKTYLNPKDYAEFTFFSLQPEVTENKESFIKDKHFFYIEDKEREAEVSIRNDDKAFEAESYVRKELNVGRYKDLLLMMNYDIRGLNVNPDTMTDSEVRASVINACRKHPENVLKFKSSDSDEVLFIIKLMKYSILEKRNGIDIYYRDQFISSSFDGVRSWLHKSENNHLVTKWGKTIQEREGVIPEKQEPSNASKRKAQKVESE